MPGGVRAHRWLSRARAQQSGANTAFPDEFDVFDVFGIRVHRLRHDETRLPEPRDGFRRNSLLERSHSTNSNVHRLSICDAAHGTSMDIACIRGVQQTRPAALFSSEYLTFPICVRDDPDRIMALVLRTIPPDTLPRPLAAAQPVRGSALSACDWEAKYSTCLLGEPSTSIFSTAKSARSSLQTRNHLEHPEVLLCQFPEIDPLIRLEVECQFPSIPAVSRPKPRSPSNSGNGHLAADSPLILRVNNLHWQSPRQHLFPTDHQGFIFVPLLLHHPSRQISTPLRMVLISRRSVLTPAPLVPVPTLRRSASA